VRDARAQYVETVWRFAGEAWAVTVFVVGENFIKAAATDAVNEPALLAAWRMLKKEDQTHKAFRDVYTARKNKISAPKKLVIQDVTPVAPTEVAP